MFYTFNQNNSGGHFDENRDRGITHYVIIEAENAEQANARAEDIGLYFNGCDEGMDCPCCGDRWYPTYAREGSETPQIYGRELDVVALDDTRIKWTSGMAAVHFLDGTFKWYDERE